MSKHIGMEANMDMEMHMAWRRYADSLGWDMSDEEIPGWAMAEIEAMREMGMEIDPTGDITPEMIAWAESQA